MFLRGGSISKCIFSVTSVRVDYSLTMPMPRSYTQLNLEDREVIQEMLYQGSTQQEIAETLGRTQSTISRELTKHKKAHNRYRPYLAQKRTTIMRRRRGNRPRLKNLLIGSYVHEKLRLRWSPEEIAGRLPQDRPGNSISHESIYQYIYASCYREGYGEARGEDLRIYLRRRHKRRTRKNLSYKSRQGTIPNRISIEQRPRYIEQRQQIGHWEGDSMVSRKSRVGLNTLVERACGLVHISKIANATALETMRAVTERLGQHPASARRSLTLDNGKENADHVAITASLGTTVYFAHPYCSWERGSNENTNGLIRQYLPKGTDFAAISVAHLQFIEHQLNNRPRKRLHFQTPLEVFAARMH